MFGLLTKEQTVRDVKCNLIITMNISYKSNQSKREKQITDLDNLASGLGHSRVVIFGRRSGNSVLFYGFPRNQCIANLERYPVVDYHHIRQLAQLESQ